MGFIYLAQPYSDKNPDVQENRYRLGCTAVARIIAAGHYPFSPIAHCHKIAEVHGLPGDASYWKSYNEQFLAAASELWVLPLPGWERSVGVQVEIAWWKKYKRIYEKYCRLLDYNALFKQGEVGFLEVEL